MAAEQDRLRKAAATAEAERAAKEQAELKAAADADAEREAKEKAEREAAADADAKRAVMEKAKRDVAADAYAVAEPAATVPAALEAAADERAAPEKPEGEMPAAAAIAGPPAELKGIAMGEPEAEPATEIGLEAENTAEEEQQPRVEAPEQETEEAPVREAPAVAAPTICRFLAGETTGVPASTFPPLNSLLVASLRGVRLPAYLGDLGYPYWVLESPPLAAAARIPAAPILAAPVPEGPTFRAFPQAATPRRVLNTAVRLLMAVLMILLLLGIQLWIPEGSFWGLAPTPGLSPWPEQEQSRLIGTPGRQLPHRGDYRSTYNQPGTQAQAASGTTSPTSPRLTLRRFGRSEGVLPKGTDPRSGGVPDTPTEVHSAADPIAYRADNKAPEDRSWTETVEDLEEGQLLPGELASTTEFVTAVRYVPIGLQQLQGQGQESRMMAA